MIPALESAGHARTQCWQARLQCRSSSTGGRAPNSVTLPSDTMGPSDHRGSAVWDPIRTERGGEGPAAAQPIHAARDHAEAGEQQAGHLEPTETKPLPVDIGKGVGDESGQPGQGTVAGAPPSESREPGPGDVKPCQAPPAPSPAAQPTDEMILSRLRRLLGDVDLSCTTGRYLGGWEGGRAAQRAWGAGRAPRGILRSRSPAAGRGAGDSGAATHSRRCHALRSPPLCAEKMLRRSLEKEFGVDLAARKALIRGEVRGDWGLASNQTLGRRRRPRDPVARGVPARIRRRCSERDRAAAWPIAAGGGIPV